MIQITLFDSNIVQLRLQLKTAKNEINHDFGTTRHRLKIQKAKMVKIKFPIELSNFYLTETLFWYNHIIY